MRRSISCMLVMGLVCSLVLAPGLYAQATKDTKTGLDRIEGTESPLGDPAGTR